MNEKADSINLHIYPTLFKYESRMMKETKSIIDAKLIDQVWIAAIWEEGLTEYEYLDDRRKVRRVKLRFGGPDSGLVGKMMRHIEWQIKVFGHFYRYPIRLVNAHSLAVLPVSALFKIFSRAKIVYDTHELETETANSVGIRQRLSKMVEKVFISFVDVTVTVNESIAQWYRDNYHLNNVYAVRNVPYQQNTNIIKTDILRNKFKLNDDEILFIYQGYLSYGRGIKILLEAFTKVDQQKHIVFMGPGEHQGLVKKYEQEHPNIHFQEAVPPQDIRRYTSGADVGISLIEDVCLSYFLSLPNKAFEYIMSGLPLIVSDFPEMSRLIDESQTGWKIAVNQEAFFSLIQSITWGDVMSKRKAVYEYRKAIGWHKEEPILLNAYREAMQNGNYTKA